MQSRDHLQPFYPVNWIEMLPEKLKQPSTELMSAFASAWPVILLAITGIQGTEDTTVDCARLQNYLIMKPVLF
jgi:hypothetical protein